MRLLILGSGGYHPTERRHTPCLMLPELGIVFDAGSAIFRVRSRVATKELDIFLTHAHLDHVMGLTFLHGLRGRVSLDRVTVHGEPEKLAAIQQHLFNDLLFPVDPACDFRPVEQNYPLPERGRLTHFPLPHPGGTLGYRIDWPDRALAYVTDTTASVDADYVEKIRGVDVLVHECYFPDGMEEFAKATGHSTVTPVAEVARAAEVGVLILMHMDPAGGEDDPVGLDAARRVFEATELGRDEMEIDF